MNAEAFELVRQDVDLPDVPDELLHVLLGDAGDAEQRATLSADGTRLYFGRLGGVWVSERTVR